MDMTQIRTWMFPNTMIRTRSILHIQGNIDPILNYSYEHSYSNCLDFQLTVSRHKNKWYLDNHRNHLDTPFRMDNLK